MLANECRHHDYVHYALMLIPASIVKEKMTTLRFGLHHYKHHNVVTSSSLLSPPLPQADCLCGAVVRQSPVLRLHRPDEDRRVCNMAEK